MTRCNAVGGFVQWSVWTGGTISSIARFNVAGEGASSSRTERGATPSAANGTAGGRASSGGSTRFPNIAEVILRRLTSPITTKPFRMWASFALSRRWALWDSKVTEMGEGEGKGFQLWLLRDSTHAGYLDLYELSNLKSSDFKIFLAKGMYRTRKSWTNSENEF